MTQAAGSVDDTSLKTVEVDLDAIFDGTASADNVVLSDSKPSVLSKENKSIDFLDEEPQVETSANTIDAVLDADIKPAAVEQDENQPDTKQGRPKSDKSVIASYLKEKIEAKEMDTFDDYDESKQTLEEYLNGLPEKEIKELLELNIKGIKQREAEEVPKQFFESLPEELQYAAKYHFDGGKDMKTILKILSQVEEVRELSPETEEGQIQIARQFLQATQFGTPEEIEEEITSWKDLGTLKKKAENFKPKLDGMHEEMIQSKLAEQENIKKQQQAAANKYIQTVHSTLESGELNGLKLDKKTQAELYYGLTEASYMAASGRPTNKLGYLLEKHQFIEPNMPLVAEALWLLSDPDSYKNSLVQKGKNQQVETTVKQLKTDRQRGQNNNQSQETTGNTSRRIPKPDGKFFQRP